jgi:hypothetical protein
MSPTAISRASAIPTPRPSTEKTSTHPSNPAWRNEALTRIGTALEKTGDLNTTVATYYDVFKPTAQASTEFFWFYKAGFAAARILESTQKWPEAIRVYETLAQPMVRVPSKPKTASNNSASNIFSGTANS